jgi:D-alanyl-D-alanine carboxypeptidase (penicillin-binding protein 5/6)
MDKPAPMVSA